jgi:hypothetical protein
MTSTTGREPDLIGTGGMARALRKSEDQALVYSRAMHERRVRGVMRADNGRYYVTPAALARMVREFGRSTHV